MTFFIIPRRWREMTSAVAGQQTSRPADLGQYPPGLASRRYTTDYTPTGSSGNSLAWLFDAGHVTSAIPATTLCSMPSLIAGVRTATPKLILANDMRFTLAAVGLELNVRAIAAMIAILLLFHAMVTSVHRSEAKPRNRNYRKRSTDLLMPNTGSTICLRKP